MKAESTLIGLNALRVDTKRYISAVGRGRSFTVLRRSRPIFKISPVDVEADDEEEGWTGIDLRDKKGRGMPADKLLRIIEKFNESH